MSWESLKQSIQFTKGERTALWYFVTLLLLIVAINVCLRNSGVDPKLTDDQVSELYDLIQESEQDKKPFTKRSYASSERKLTPRQFNPNTVTYEELVDMGWPTYPARMLTNYAKKGGKYRSARDVKKVYGMSDELYVQIEPFIDLPSASTAYPKKKQYDDRSWKKEQKATSVKKEQPPLQITPFNPNTVSQEELLAMNIPRRVVSTWVKFRDKGKVYRDIDDIASIYGLDSTLLSALEPHLIFEVSGETDAKNPTDSIVAVKVIEEPKIDINTATQEELIAIRGIGPAFSKEIIRYRDALGGYYSLDQLYETWMPRDAIDNFIDRLAIITPHRTMDINTMNFKQVMNHPYITKRSTNLLKTYFRLRPQRTDLDRFVRVTEINADTMQMLLPYLRLED